MAITILPQPSIEGTTKAEAQESAVGLFRSIYPEGTGLRIVQTSFPFSDGDKIIPYSNGFVDTVQQDLHLEIRTDDVWLVILSQLSFFVNANAESLQDTFVCYKDKRELILDVRPLGLDQMDAGYAAQIMADTVFGALKDSDYGSWMMPDFSITSHSDRSTAAAMFLGAMKAYFDSSILCGCDFPSVTLHGERSGNVPSG
ncbi:hypothetical protein HIM_05605 [Hirsutella minnesotensis 3608]|uniref:Uncharacterized protein n=1 Tax=Hirsutella minnesotensis 3608 TaxID=1043627 RepID=A0A0F8A5D1_9HYPO|nr:hypothetical protein HIM_05605 [Hirsutella minnesotensis 3608]